MIGAVAIIASIIGALVVRTKTDRVEGALYQGVILAGILSIAAFYPITDWLMSDPVRLGLNTGADAVSVTDLWLCAVIGVAVTALLFVITEFYTSTRFRPVKSIAAGLGDRATRRTSSRGSPRASSRPPPRRWCSRWRSSAPTSSPGSTASASP